MKRSHGSSPKTPVKQARISSFFTSPSAKRVNKSASPLAERKVVDHVEDDRFKQQLADEELARNLQMEWDNEQLNSHARSSASVVEETVSEPVKKEDHIEEAIASTSTATVTNSSNGSSNINVDLVQLDVDISSIKLDTDIFAFEVDSVSTFQWPLKSSMEHEEKHRTTPYALLAHAFALLSATRSRLAIVTILTNLLRVLMKHDPEALLPSIYLVSNHIAPPYDGVELGLGGSIVNRAIRDVTGKSSAFLRTLWNKTGDPGDVAFMAKRDVKTLIGNRKPIEVVKLFNTLHQIAAISGSGSSSAKLSHITKLLVACRGEETRFLVRTLHSHLRINAVKTTITSAIARAFSLDGPGQDESLMVSVEQRSGILANVTKAKERHEPKRLELMEKLNRGERLVREVRARHPNFSSIVPALLEGGLEQLSKRVPLRIGTPISPMLGSITKSLPAMHSKLGHRAFVSEFKYDGQRVQIHAIHLPRNDSNFQEMRKTLKGGKGKWVGTQGNVYVRLFSRHLEDMTDKYPDINDMIPLLMGLQDGKASQDDEVQVKSFIMDAEVVALSLEGTLLPFQTLANRSRKDVELNQVKVRVGIFAFDLMYLNGKSLLKSSFRKRRSLLHRLLPPIEPQDVRIARFNHVKSLESNSVDDVEEFFNLARVSKCEGIMVKSLDHHWQQPVEKIKEGQEEASENIQLLDDEIGEGISWDDDDADDEDDDNNDEKAHERTKDKAKGVNGRGKALLSTYEPDKRCESWLKVKKDYIDGIGDSLDLVPIGGWHGMGRKSAWWSPVLLALYDAKEGQYQAVCKCISGFTDAEYKSMKFERFVEGSETCYDARSQPCRDSYDTGGLLPDFWFTPKEVWEIRGADVTLSPVYNAAKGLVSMERGLSLRFPRFLKRRFDKNPEDATTPQQLANIYKEQNQSGGELGGGGGVEVNYRIDAANEDQDEEEDEEEGGEEEEGEGEEEETALERLTTED